MRLGIMQGRLSPRVDGKYQFFPSRYWRDEFDLANKKGFDYIELIYDDIHNNPLETERGCLEIAQLKLTYQIETLSICGDWFIENPIHHPCKTLRALNKSKLILLISRVQKLGVHFITIPCIEEASLKTEDDVNRFKDALEDIVPVAETFGINICIESDWAPDELLDLTNYFKSDRILINYDTGNSTGYGYRARKEIATYGNKIGVVHIKDKKRRGESVELGTGDTDFREVFHELNICKFSGLITMQAFREKSYERDMELLDKQIKFTRHAIARWLI